MEEERGAAAEAPLMDADGVPPQQRLKKRRNGGRRWGLSSGNPSDGAAKRPKDGEEDNNEVEDRRNVFSVAAFGRFSKNDGEGEKNLMDSHFDMGRLTADSTRAGLEGRRKEPECPKEEASHRKPTTTAALPFAADAADLMVSTRKIGEDVSDNSVVDRWRRDRRCQCSRRRRPRRRVGGMYGGRQAMMVVMTTMPMMLLMSD